MSLSRFGGLRPRLTSSTCIDESLRFAYFGLLVKLASRAPQTRHRSEKRSSQPEPTMDMLEVTSRIRIPLREFDFTFARSSGPGGQNVNKLNTKATLRWRVARSESLPAAVRGRFMEKYRRRLTADGDILVVSQRFRDQGRNVADCLTKLREMIAAVVPPPKVRKKTRPTRAARERRLAEKRAQSQRKQSRRAPRRDDD